MFDERFFRPFERLPEGEDGLEVLSLDVAEMDKNLIVKARLPGLRPEEVDISISGNVLTIKGESREETGEEKATYHYYELRYGAVQRTIPLPVEVNRIWRKPYSKMGCSI